MSFRNSNKVLFTFDSLVDLHLAVVKALQKDFPSGGPSINYSFLFQTDKDLKQKRVFDIGKNVVQECFTGTARKSYETIYKSYIVDRFDETIQHAPITLMPKLIGGYSTFGNYIRCYVLCETESQENIAKNILKKFPDVTYLRMKPEDVDINDFARVIVGDVKDIDLFKSPECVYIGILNYGSNLQVVKGKVLIRPEYIVKYGDINTLQIVDSYSDVEVPNKQEGES